MFDREISVADLVRKMEDEDQTGNTKMSKYVTFSMRETIEKVDAYLNSKHTSGDKDSMGRDKPFFNIVTAAVNIWYRATDIDRKNIILRATRQDQHVLAFIVTILLQEYMRKSAFGKFLNEWGRVLARYGSAILKFIEKDGELFSEVMPWNRMLVDPVDFDNNIKVERLWFTVAQLRAKKEYDQILVEELINAQTIRKTLDGQKTDNKSNYIEVFELHGELSLAYLTDKESDEDTYVDQTHVISYVAKKEGATSDKKFDDFTLYAGRESKSPYMITHLIKEDGRTLSIGAVEHLFESQWMVNHNAKAIKDQLDLASKLIFQTSDGNFIGQNVLNSIENGQVLIWSSKDGGSPLTQVQNNSHDISALQSYGSQWKDNGREINGIAESMVQQAKSGAAWRQTRAELQEAHSLFELMIENKGLDLEIIMIKRILPYLKKKMDTTDEIAAILEEHKINKLDSMYVPAEATKRVNKQIKDDILNKTPEDIEAGNLFPPEQQQENMASEEQAIQKALNVFGSQRFIKPSDISTKTWKTVLKDFEWDVEIDVTGESKDKEAILTTLTTVLQTIGTNPLILQDPNMKMLFNKILSETGAISPIEISSVPQPQQEQEEKPKEQLIK